MALKKFYSKRYIQPIIHILFWSLLIFSPYLFRNEESWKGFSGWQMRVLIYKVFSAILFYFNYFYLYPSIYKKKGIGQYLLAVILVLIVMVSLSFAIDRLYFDGLRDHDRPKTGIGEKMHNRHRHGSGFGFLMGMLWNVLLPYQLAIVVSFSFRIYADNLEQEKLRKEKENENLKTELSFLRSQVSPHFIFNVLNNLVSLARKKSDLLEPSLIQLSNLIRYMLYENDDEKVSLEREVAYLQNYIDLQLLRFGDDVTVKFDPQGDLNGYLIEPMLLTAFVENAFKHGVGMIENPHIEVAIKVNRETNWLDFKVMNNVSAEPGAKDKSSGIGLNNVKRRLELLYQDRHQLEIRQTVHEFVIDLKIKLQ